MLIPGTLIGGSRPSIRPITLAILPGGDVIAAGNTRSADFPATAGTPAGAQDVWVARFDGLFRQRLWTRQLGGSAGEAVAATALAFDAAGDIYLAGTDRIHRTSPPPPPSTRSANGAFDIFLVKLDGATGGILSSTYLGGSGDDLVRGLAVDTSAAPCSPGAPIRPTFPQVDPIAVKSAGRDAFLSRFAPGGASLEVSTYYGGAFEEDFSAVALDTSNNVYLALVAGDLDSGLSSNRLLKFSGASFALVYDFPYGPETPAESDGPTRIERLAVDGLGRATFAGATQASSGPAAGRAAAGQPARRHRLLRGPARRRRRRSRIQHLPRRRGRRDPGPPWRSRRTARS